MDSPIQAVQAPYRGGGSNYIPPAPNISSLLLKERIVYLGRPLSYNANVSLIIVAQLLYLQFDNPEKPITMYINSPGTSYYGGDPVGWETEAFAICDTMSYIKPPIHTICIGQVMGTAAMILSSGTKGFRASLSNSTIVLHQARNGARGQATDIQIRAKEVIENRRNVLDIFSKNTGQTIEKLKKDTDRMFYMTPQEAKDYGLIDRVLESSKDLPTPSPVSSVS